MSDIIIAASIAVAGVVFTQISLHRMEAKKAERERKKDSDARRYAIKRELYAGAISAFQEATVAINQMAVSDARSIGQVKASQEALNAMSTLALAASSEVHEKVMEAGRQGTMGLLKLVSIKSNDFAIENELNDLPAKIQQHLEALNEVAAQMKNLVERSDPDSSLSYRTLEQEATQLQDALLNFFEKQKTLAHDRLKLLMEMADFQMQFLPELSRVQLDAILAMRADLDIPTDAAHMKLVSERHVAEAIKVGRDHVAQSLSLLESVTRPTSSTDD